MQTETVYLPKGRTLVADLIAATVKAAPERVRTLRYGFEDGISEPVSVSDREVHTYPAQVLHFVRMFERGELAPKSVRTLVPVQEFMPDDAHKCFITWSEARAFCESCGLDLQPLEAPAAAPLAIEPASEPAPAAPAAAPANALRSEPPWMEAARNEARRIRKERVGKGWFPSLEMLGDEVAKVFLARGINGPNGHPLAGSTIKRQALQGHGITNDAAKLHQTLNKRGK